jgi:hypothetical protein
MVITKAPDTARISFTFHLLNSRYRHTAQKRIDSNMRKFRIPIEYAEIPGNTEDIPLSIQLKSGCPSV